MIDKFCFITDSHFARHGPKSRIDDYFKTLMKKLKWVIRYCKENSIINVLHGGDMFDNPFVSDYVAGTVAGLFSNSGLQVYSILGQHDITGKNAASYVHGKMHLFEHYPWFNMIGGEYIKFNNCYVTGFDYNEDVACPSSLNIKKKNKPVVCLLHAMVSGEEQIQIADEFKLVPWNTITTKAYVTLTGDYHIGYKPKYGTFNGHWCNPGSFARTSITDDKKGIGPGLVDLRIYKNGNIKLKRVEIPHDVNVFKITVTGSSDNERRKFELAFKELQNREVNGNDVNAIFETIAINIDKKKYSFVNSRTIKLCKRKFKELRNENNRNSSTVTKSTNRSRSCKA